MFQHRQLGVANLEVVDAGKQIVGWGKNARAEKRKRQFQQENLEKIVADLEIIDYKTTASCLGNTWK